ncbi:MAG: hypothetical protein AAF226_07030 [Verrucomicrobiota bacterium]
MKRLCLTTLVAIATAFLTTGSAAATELPDFQKVLKLQLELDKKSPDTFLVHLTNLWDQPLELAINEEKIEGEFLNQPPEALNGSFYDHEYLTRLMTGVWFSGQHTIEPLATMTWKVKLSECTYAYDGPAVTAKSLQEQTYKLRLDRISVSPGLNKKSINFQLESNALTFPKAP